MKVTKQQIVEGIAQYVRNEVITGIPEQGLKVFMGGAIYAALSNQAITDKYVFSNPIFLAATNAEEDGYDLEFIIEGFKQAVKEYGNFTVTIPRIFAITKDEKLLSFTANDFDKLKSYIERSA